ncbi:fibronectin type III domain-containing protein [Danxiaibacter flavus]|uniref:Fibronectin type III domain-containing protein n=1 Tax=Danxiaibacter flavus TaxID=3049108 RepID=A0ABV3ZG93_9BACT|nr:fibronectin type III domain-containing protein [Chitinophagaceae bacterium DXS]
MKTKSRNILALLLLAFSYFIPGTALSQTGVLDPTDPIVIYDPGNPPTIPANGTLVKWVKTNRLKWNTTSFKCYFYNGVAFRLKFPKTYQAGVNDGKKYPVFVFYHGLGEKGTIYDNELQLYHGGQLHMNAVDNGQFDGFLLYPQSQENNWYGQLAVMNDFINKYLVPQAKADPWRVYADGLSAGGRATWLFMELFPKTVAAGLPISATVTGSEVANYTKSFKFIPIWQFQGGLDSDPLPEVSQAMGQRILDSGGNYKLTIYPNDGHGCWYDAWGEPDYFPFMLRQYKSNPWVLGGRTEFCPTDTISATMGVTAGFDGYQWRLNGNPIQGATSNTYTATTLGTYDCRILNGNNWSDWSPTPVVIKIKTTTIPPVIMASANSSAVLPVLDGSAGVRIEVPAGYVSYAWTKDSSTTVLSTTRNLTATTPGQYRVKVTEKFGCSSSFSDPFTVIDGNAANGPDAPTGINASALSKTSVQLTWNQTAAPAYNETGFEIYRATSAGGPYTLAQIAPTDATGALISQLNPGTKYFFMLRAINNNAASQPTIAVSTTTLRDTTAPTVPGDFMVTAASQNEIDVIWNSSTDDVGVVAYDIYINGIKSYTSKDTSYKIFGLSSFNTYNIYVKARDFAGNVSIPSNQATASTSLRGLNYKFYMGQWSALPDFNAMTPDDRGVVHNVDISGSTEAINFGYLFQGYLKIPAAGSYTFRLSSDDGSKLFVDTPYTQTGPSTINYDGIHSAGTKDATKTLTAGIHNIAIAYFQQGGGASCSLLWKVPGSSTFVPVPDSAFTDGYVPAGTAPAGPSGLTATGVAYNQINLAWTDNSNNENGFEIYRSTSGTGPFFKVGVAPANATSYKDSADLAPTTQYFYRIKAVGPYGESAFNDDATFTLKYNYYTGSFNVISDFANSTPVSSGTIENFLLSVSPLQTNYGIRYDGVINIKTAGAYTFYTTSDDGSSLYIDGNLVVNNDGAHGAQEKSGNVTLTAGVHSIRTYYFQKTGGASLTVSYKGPNIAKAPIPDAVLRVDPVNATTTALPGAPQAPTNLVATATSPSVAALTWAPADNLASNFEVYRSTNDNTTYALIKVVKGSQAAAYNDSSVTANTTYFYKVRAMNVTGPSPYSNEATTTTLNNKPVISHINNVNMNWGVQTSVNINATDIDDENLSITFGQLPSFAAYTATGNGQGQLILTPDASDAGTSNSVKVYVMDEHGGEDSTTFTINVSNTQPPSLDSIPDVTLTEGTSTTVNLSGSLHTGDVVTGVNLPSFATLIDNGNNSYSIFISPAVSQSGTYNNIGIMATNSTGASATKLFNLVVTQKALTGIYINFNPATGGQPTAPWNNTKGVIAAGSVVSNLKDENNVSTGINMTLVDAWDGSNTNGAIPNGLGIYPDNVIRTQYYSAASSRLITFSNIPAGNKYNVIFFSSRAGSPTASDNRIMKYTIGGQTVQLAIAQNISKTAQINNVAGDANGQIQATLAKDAGALSTIIDAMVLQSIPADTTTTVAPPTNVAATGVANDKITLTWNAASGTETGFEIWRSPSANGAYNKKGTVAGNVLTYTDTALASGVTYYYIVKAVVNNNSSAFGNPVNATTLTDAPLIPGNITATGIGLDKIKLTWTGNGKETGFEIWRSTASNGSFNKVGTVPGTTLTFTDGGLASNTTYYYQLRSSIDAAYSGFSASVSGTTLNPYIPSVYINFAAPTGAGAPLPWNNTAGNIAAGYTLPLVDSTGSATGMSMKLVDSWLVANTVGVTTNSNTGVYPDNVMKTIYYDSSANGRHIQLSGLQSSRKYDVIFFTGRAGNPTTGDTRIVNYSINGRSVSLAASPSNTTKTVQLNGISPDASGNINITIIRDAGAVYQTINAMVVQQHVFDGIPYAPAQLAAASTASDKIRLDWQLLSLDADTTEVWRSTSANGTYTKIGIAAPYATTYTDAGLATNTVYYYKVRAKDPVNGFSPYSNIAAAGTRAFNLNINFNDGSTGGPAQAGWNNTNTPPEPDLTLENLVNDKGLSTGITMTIIDNFSGSNLLGATTGNNSGIYPDNVLKSFYYLDYKDTAIMQFSGLNQSMVYTFVFVPSTTYNSNTNTVYKIGNQLVQLSGWKNTANSVQISNVAPDASGNINVTVYSTTGYGYLNGMSIQGAPAPAGLNNRIANTTGRSAGDIKPVIPADNDEVKVKAYPNPFTDDVTIKMNLGKNASKVAISVTDVSGNIIYLREVGSVSKGLWQQNLGLNGRLLKSGVYFVRVMGLPGNTTRVIKIVK